MNRDHDLIALVDEWPLPGLSPAHRAKIKSELLKAQATYYRLSMRELGFEKPMQMAFTGIAAILFDASLLTIEILENQLRLLMVEAAMIGGWMNPHPDDPRVEIFPGFFGHQLAWSRFNQHGIQILFASTAEWHSRLLDQSAEGAQQPTATARPDPRILRDSFFARFPNEKILDVCWAAGQHYSEWKRWLRRAVKDGSAPDRAFRAILTSGKASREYRKQPRPDGWK